MKKSEARILIFLSIAKDRLTYAKYMSFKLDMDYGYLIEILSNMRLKKWINCVKVNNKKFYHITDKTQIEIAKIRLGKK